jgi:hypothetical protein
MQYLHGRAARTALAASLISLACAASASAGVGDTVNVRIEGKDATLLARKQITLQAGTVPGNSGCPMTTIGGAIETATGGDWDRQTFTSTIRGESHTFTDSDYWAGWVNNRYGDAFCSQQLNQGDDVLVTYDKTDNTTFASSVFPVELAIPATIDRGAPVGVHATEYRNYTGAPSFGSTGVGDPQPAAGLSIASAGAATAVTDAQGNAAMTFPAAGSYTVQGTRGAERSVPVTVCVHDGADGSCGTAKPPPPPVPVATGTAKGIAPGQTFAAAKAPRTLSGSFDTGSTGLRAVELRLMRRYRGHCQYYSVLAERFNGTARCSPGAYYRYLIGDQPDWSYLLPSRLKAGSYTLEVTATDRNGFRATQTRRFTVK